MQRKCRVIKLWILILIRLQISIHACGSSFYMVELDSDEISRVESVVEREKAGRTCGMEAVNDESI